jgi:thioredoxin-like negative regulator of GroEL
VRLARAGIGSAAFVALDQGDRETALDGLLEEMGRAGEETREDLRRAIVGILSEGDQADPSAREYRRRLAAALY